MTTISYNQAAFYDFERAVRKAAWRDRISWLTRKCNDLLSFEQIRRCLSLKGQHPLGLQIVALDKIVGSEGRAHDFDRAFFPRSAHTQQRWIGIAQANYAQVPLPPVDLVKIGENYFVTDGHHRISVARAQGQDFIDAYVTEIDIPISVEQSGKLQSNFSDC
jgi:hypothetical protein